MTELARLKFYATQPHVCSYLPDEQATTLFLDPSQPMDAPTFPSGDGVSGGDFVARFTVDSRAELGSWAAGTAYLDVNGNFVFDPENADSTNRDLAHTLGFASDVVFTGNFVQAAGGTAEYSWKNHSYTITLGPLTYLAEEDGRLWLYQQDGSKKQIADDFTILPPFSETYTLLYCPADKLRDYLGH